MDDRTPHDDETPEDTGWPWIVEEKYEPKVDVVEGEVEDHRPTPNEFREKLGEAVQVGRSLGVEPIRDVVRGYARRGLDKFDELLAGAAGEKKNEPKD